MLGDGDPDRQAAAGTGDGGEQSDARWLTNLAISQWEIGDLEAARMTLQRVLAIFEADLGPEHPDVARTLTNLGIVQWELGDLEMARATHERTVAILEAISSGMCPSQRALAAARVAVVPWAQLLESCARGEHVHVAVARADDLHADRQPISETSR